jgi:uncharacterized protein
MRKRSKARRGLTIFFVVLCLLAAVLELARDKIPFSGVLRAQFIPLYMWCVAGASLVSRLLMREPIGDISFRWRSKRIAYAMAVATAFPLVVGFGAFGFAWAAGLSHFVPNTIPGHEMRIPIAGAPVTRFWEFLLVSVSIGALSLCKSAAGEEIGWRGYMLTRLIRAGFPAPIFLSGLIWALWHLPLILCRQYSSIAVSPLPIAIFCANITAAGYVFAWLRLYSRSIWPCIWGHGVWNAVVLGPFAVVTTGGGIWVGEGGVLTTVAVILFAWGLYLASPVRTKLRQQGEPALVEAR